MSWNAKLKPRPQPPLPPTEWGRFRARYEAEYAFYLRAGTRSSIGTALNHAEKIFKPKKAADALNLNAFFRRAVKELGICRDSAITYVKRLREALEWGRRHRFHNGTIKMPDLPKNRSRRLPPAPMTPEQIQSVLAAAKESGPEIDLLIRGLLMSGMRISEAESLKWNEGPFRVQFAGKCPMFEVEHLDDKAHSDRLIPMTQDFADLLMSVPAEKRSGYVFLPTVEDRTKLAGIVSGVGRRANVVMGMRADKVKYATAHDYRRTFASTWALLVEPFVLQKMMRHDSLTTTMRYYVRCRAEQIASHISGVRAFHYPAT